MKYVRIEVEIGPLPDDVTWDSTVAEDPDEVTESELTLVGIQEWIADYVHYLSFIDGCDVGTHGQILPASIAYPTESREALVRAFVDASNGARDMKQVRGLMDAYVDAVNAEQVEPVEGDAFGFRRARGAVQAPPGSPPAEELIRKVREQP